MESATSWTPNDSAPPSPTTLKLPAENHCSNVCEEDTAVQKETEKSPPTIIGP